MKYTIIEDCSPYYIRFTFDGLQDIIKFASSQSTELIRQLPGYRHEHYNLEEANTIISMLPMSPSIKFKNSRVALFNTPPGGGCGIHKDGSDAKVSLNIPIEILNDKCLTHWYTDDTLKDLPLNLVRGYSRNVWPDWKSTSQFSPVKTMTAVPNEMILFNTEIYHCWNNQHSTKTRKIITLRTVDTSITFEDMRKLMFGC
jgi:hypothetical protein